MNWLARLLRQRAATPAGPVIACPICHATAAARTVGDVTPTHPGPFGVDT